MRLIIIFMTLAFAEVCGNTQPPGETKAAATFPPERRCRLARGPNESPECFAVRCAEDFVRRNGYTVEAATGPIVGESVDSPTLEQRRGTLERAAVGYRPSPPGHLVVFKYSSSQGKTARAVTMSASFDNLRVQHQDFLLAGAGSVPKCAAANASASAPAPPTSATANAPVEQALIAHLPLSDKRFGSEADVSACQALERAHETEIENARAGEMDGNEIGQGECTLFMYGPSADKLLDVVSRRLRSSRLAKRGWVVKRYGSAEDARAKEVRVDLEVAR